MSRTIKKTVYLNPNLDYYNTAQPTIFEKDATFNGKPALKATLIIELPEKEVTLKLTRAKLAKLWDSRLNVKQYGLNKAADSAGFDQLCKAMGLDNE